MQHLVAILCLLAANTVSGFTPLSIRPHSHRAAVSAATWRAMPLKSSAKDVELDEDTDEEERQTREEAAQIAQRKRSNMYNENGVAYAPWMLNQIDEEAYVAAKEIRKMRKKREKQAAVQAEGAMLSTDLQADELSGTGLRFRFIGDEVELSWSTGSEPNNLGYRVQKRAARSEDWITVASYEDWAPLNSKGIEGGTYTFLDPTSDNGDWIYRIVDVDQWGKTTVLCQALVEVQSAGERTLQLALAGGFALVFAGMVTAGFLADPLQ